MKQDVGMWWKFLGKSPKEDLSAIHFLSEIDDEDVERIATGMLESVSTVDSSLVAITSFIPEVDLEDDVERADVAINGLLRVALEIGKQKGSAPPVVQMVAGSSVERIVKNNGKFEVESADAARYV